MSVHKKPENRARPRARRSLHVVIDRELDALVAQSAATDGLSTSAIVRDALRSYFHLADPRGRGWREGFAAGIADVQRRVREALSELEVGQPHR